MRVRVCYLQCIRRTSGHNHSTANVCAWACSQWIFRITATAHFHACGVYACNRNAHKNQTKRQIKHMPANDSSTNNFEKWTEQYISYVHTKEKWFNKRPHAVYYITRISIKIAEWVRVYSAYTVYTVTHYVTFQCHRHVSLVRIFLSFCWIMARLHDILHHLN